MKHAVIGSGSKANSYIIESNSNLYVIDNGFSLKEFKKRINSMGFDYSKIKGIFLTHKHADHKLGVGRLSRDLKIPVYSSSNLNDNFYKHIPVEANKKYILPDIEVITFQLSHDTDNPIGYSIKTSDNQRFTVITDTGLITPEMYMLAKYSTNLLIEANYNKKILQENSYPDKLKLRISGDTGHLSNNQTIELLNDLSKEHGCLIKNVYLCHISENSNSPEAIKEDFKNLYNGRFNYIICNNNESVIIES